MVGILKKHTTYRLMICFQYTLLFLIFVRTQIKEELAVEYLSIKILTLPLPVTVFNSKCKSKSIIFSSSHIHACDPACYNITLHCILDGTHVLLHHIIDIKCVNKWLKHFKTRDI